MRYTIANLFAPANDVVYLELGQVRGMGKQCFQNKATTNLSGRAEACYSVYTLST